MEYPTCCGEKTEFIGVTEGGSNKFHCRQCYQITMTNKVRNKKGDSPEGLSDRKSD